MPASIGNAALVLSVASAAFDKGLADAEKKVKTFEQKVAAPGAAAKGPLTTGQAIQNMAGMLSRIPAMWSAIGVAVGFAADRIKSLNADIKFARQMGMDPQQFQGLAFAAGGADELRMGMHRLAETIGRVRDGSIEAKTAFRKIGVDAEEITRIPLDEAFMRIAEGLQSIPNEADKMAALKGVFGRQSRELAKIFAKGPEGLRREMALARDLGQVLEHEQIARVERASKAMKRAGQAGEGLWTQVSVGLAPVVEAISNLTAGALQAIIPFVKAGMEGVARLTEWVVGKFTPAFTAAYNVIRSVAEVLGQWAVLLTNGIIDGLDFLLIETGFSDALDAMGSEWIAWTNWAGEQWQSWTDWFTTTLETGWNRASRLLEDTLGDSMESLFSRGAESSKTAMQEIVRAFSYLGDAWKILGGYFMKYFTIPLRDFFSLLVKQLERLMGLAAKLPGFLGGDRVAAARDDLRRWREEFDGAVDGMRAEAERGINTRFGDSFAGWWEGLEAAAAAAGRLGGALEGVAERARAFAEQRATQRWLDQINREAQRIEEEMARRDALRRENVIAIGAEVEALRDKIEQQNNEWGRTGHELERFRLQARGATEEQLRMLDEVLAKQNELIAQDELANKAKGLVSGLETPAEKFEQTMADLREAYGAGRINWEEFSRAGARAINELEKSLGESRLAEGLDFGSSGAAQAIIQHRLGRGQETAQDRIQRILHQANELDKVNNRQNDEIIRALRDGGRLNVQVI